jgi:hypothetical protein
MVPMARLTEPRVAIITLFCAVSTKEGRREEGREEGKESRTSAMWL